MSSPPAKRSRSSEHPDPDGAAREASAAGGAHALAGLPESLLAECLRFGDLGE